MLKVMAEIYFELTIYLTGDNFLTNGEKTGALTFYWETKNVYTAFMLDLINPIFPILVVLREFKF